MEKITPVEFEEQKLHRKVQAGDIIVWYGDQPIQWVEPRKKEDWRLCFDDGSDNCVQASVGKYELCLEIQDATDKAALRAECLERAIKGVKDLPDSELNYALRRLREYGLY